MYFDDFIDRALNIIPSSENDLCERLLDAKQGNNILDKSTCS